MSDAPMSAAVSHLRSTAAIRERCTHIADAVRAGRSSWFTVDDAALDAAADTVARVTRERYPDLRIPYHSRWRHFEAGGVDRKAEFDAAIATLDAREQARARIDLTVVSVLLDAGAGAAWHFDEHGARYARSEGLGVASFRAVMQGLFSSRAGQPCRVDGRALQRIDAAALARVFQVRDDNPLLGLDGRATLMRRLGDTLLADAAHFGADGRPGGLFDRLVPDTAQPVPSIAAAALLRAVLDGLGPIWLTDRRLDGEALGDVWPHPFAGGTGSGAGLVPFHKLSQWLVYSLLEPFEWAGVRVDGLDALTGLPEYRNGGLLLDTGVLRLRDPGLAATPLPPSHEAIVEWRALTVALIDALAPRVRTRLGKTAAEMPLACILEGGTWAAGRETARVMRGGDPPLAIVSDGTVF